MKTIIQIQGRKVFRSLIPDNKCRGSGTYGKGSSCKLLKKGLEEHYQILMELAPKDQNCDITQQDTT